PAAVFPFPGTSWWHYDGYKLVQYWKKPHGTFREDLQVGVNARYTYWQSRQPIPGGVAFENFELRERFYEGQMFVFGLAPKTPAELGLPTAKPFTVVCLGDSITHAGYPAELEKILSVQVINAGVPGNTSRQGLARLEKDVLRHRPDVVIVCFGANDSRLDAPKIHVPLKEYEQNLAEIIDRCETTGAKVLLGTLPPIDPEPYYQRHPKEYYTTVGGLEALVATYREAALRVAAARRVPVVDLNHMLTQEPAWRKPDGVHPTEAGNRIIARLFANEVEALLKKR
ncbi:MAG TPA: GDSL-type esterase/lipase family protein, partial [Tepidisphaeraceae bacterium]|nr:GDSL-type esterase/lipase family protein [Tepidisphaeraceae bacterium]